MGEGMTQAAAKSTLDMGEREVWHDEKVAALKITAAYLNKGRTNVGDT